MSPTPALTTSAARGGLGPSGGRTGLAADSFVGTPQSRRSRSRPSRPADASTSCSHVLRTTAHLASTSHSRPPAALFDRPAPTRRTTSKRVPTRLIVDLSESVVNRAFSFVCPRRIYAILRKLRGRFVHNRTARSRPGRHCHPVRPAGSVMGLAGRDPPSRVRRTGPAAASASSCAQPDSINDCFVRPTARPCRTRRSA